MVVHILVLYEYVCLQETSFKTGECNFEKKYIYICFEMEMKLLQMNHSVSVLFCNFHNYDHTNSQTWNTCCLCVVRILALCTVATVDIGAEQWEIVETG